MAIPSYFVALENHRQSTLAEFAQYVRQMPKKVAGTVQLSELCAMTDHPNGLYFFFDEHDELWYVGKSTSRSFIERIPAHFDQREDAWFNTLSSRIKTVFSMRGYADAHALGLSLRLVLVGVKSRETATRLERALRAFSKPQLNTARSRGESGRELISSYES